ncbi:MAG: hypothetical protein AAF702_49330 [Chloroflexota bacterium]
MAGETTPNSAHPNHWPAQPHWPPQNGTAPSEESPELLRWRADMRLDEMTLEAVDVSASSDPIPHCPIHQPSVNHRPFHL